MWNWQKTDWPHFSYDKEILAPYEEKFLLQMGTLFGAIKHVSEKEQEELKIELISEEALKTSKIEGEMLDRKSRQSSLRNIFGLKTNDYPVPPAEQGISEMMVNLWEIFDQPLTHEMLWFWHKKMMANRRDLDQIGNYRAHIAPMQVVSASFNKPKIHFEAPPSKMMLDEMNQYLLWFKKSGQSGLSQYDLAKVLGIPQQNIAYWEQSTKPPRSDILPKMAEALGVDIPSLIFSPESKEKISDQYKPTGKVKQLFTEVAQLPRRQQDKIVEFVSAFVQQYNMSKK